MNQSLPLYQHVDAVDDTVYLTSVSTCRCSGWWAGAPSDSGGGSPALRAPVPPPPSPSVSVWATPDLKHKTKPIHQNKEQGLNRICHLLYLCGRHQPYTNTKPKPFIQTKPVFTPFYKFLRFLGTNISVNIQFSIPFALQIKAYNTVGWCAFDSEQASHITKNWPIMNKCSFSVL